MIQATNYSRVLNIKVRMLECPKCHGFHAHWWYTSKVPPPSCQERRRAA